MGTPPDLSEMQKEQAQMLAQMVGGRPRQGCAGCLLRSILGLVAFFVIGGAIVIFFDWLSAPWAWPFFGRPTLTGEWVGTFTLPGGQHGAAYLNLTHPIPVHPGYSMYGSNLREIRGTAQTCFTPSGVQSYDVSGDGATDGKSVVMGMGAQKPTLPGYALEDLRGVWSGDPLTLSVRFTHITDTKGSTIVGGDPNETQPTTIIFHKSGQQDFVKACQSLGS